MFNKRESSSKNDEFPIREEFEPEAGSSSIPSTSTRGTPPQNTGRREAAVIGPSIHINGDLHGEEDLVIEGEVKGAIHLKSNSLTIGGQGKVTADVYAHTICVDGLMDGDLYGAERVSIRKTAQVQGNITSPRVSLEDGAKFKGTIEMDPQAETLKKAFDEKEGADKGISPSSSATKPGTSRQAMASFDKSTGENSSGKSVEVAAKKQSMG